MTVPNVPCGVESDGKGNFGKAGGGVFLMYRVELKV